MLFSSTVFLFLFLPVVLGIYYLSPNKLKNLILLLSSLFFYSWGEKYIVLVMVFSTLVDYSCGILISKGNRKTGLILSVLTNLGLLVFFKYFNFAFENLALMAEFLNLDPSALKSVPNIALPIGISFYTFQTMSYTIDLYRGKTQVNKNLLEFATYVTLFPQLVAGPIVRYADVFKQLKQKNISLNNFSEGVERFVVGLAKKVIIANFFAIIADAVFNSATLDLSSAWAWIGILAYTIQIYFDFSGYSDMAIGLGKMFGFDFLENFNYPYISKSIKEFWRRWHISLSSWFKDYVYISLGGSRVKSSRIYLNLIIVFLITGLWHGASWNFVVWGLFHGAFLIFERIGFSKFLDKIWKPIQHVYTLLVVIIGWVLFRAENLNEATDYLARMFSLSAGNSDYSAYLSFSYINTELCVMLGFAIVCATPVYKIIRTRLSKLESKGIHWKYLTQSLETVGVFFLLITSLSLIATDSYNPFIYFRF